MLNSENFEYSQGFETRIMMIEFQKVAKIYSGSSRKSLDNISLNVMPGEIFTLLGPSGSGKTTLLKMINRLIEPSSGLVKVDNKNINEFSITTLRRSIGYVFQETGLFPHMTIEKNISILLKIIGIKKKERLYRAHELLELIHLDPTDFASRYPTELSGGQKQRVAIARALVTHPKYLLMDEPFSALDPITRKNMQNEIRRLNQEFKKTIVFVTHDLFEAFHLANRVAVIRAGQLEQLGTPTDILNKPASSFIAQFTQPLREKK